MFFFFNSPFFFLNSSPLLQQPRDENGWNLDTDVAHAEPETDADFLRRQGRNFTVSSRKPAREPARPEWKAMEEESSGGFGDPPPVRKPARKPASTARKVAAKPAQSVRESSATHSEPLNIDDMPVGGGGGGGGMGRGMGGSGSGRPNFNSSGYSQYDTPAMDEAPTRTEPRRRTSARAQPPPQVQQHAHYEVDSIPVSSGMGGGGMGGGGGMDELLREAEQAQSEQQRQCHQVFPPPPILNEPIFNQPSTVRTELPRECPQKARCRLWEAEAA